ncbi:MAG: hypothetical protein ACR5K2_03840 [Wolbachia sp.]
MHPEVVELLLVALNINVGCIDLKSINSKGADKRSLFKKRVQDYRLFYKVKEAAEEKDDGNLDKLLGEIKDLVKSEGNICLSQA